MLIQDDMDYLVPLSTIQVTKLLYEGMMQIPKSSAIHKGRQARAFKTMSEIARNIPGYELHFRKSPDFWKVIDAEFGLD